MSFSGGARGGGGGGGRGGEEDALRDALAAAAQAASAGGASAYAGGDAAAASDAGLLADARAAAASLRARFATEPDFVTQLLHQDADLAQALFAADDSAGGGAGGLLLPLVAARLRTQRDAAAAQARRFAALEADPFDAAAQGEIEGEIRRRVVQENLDQALELCPELFGGVFMLYVACHVESLALKAFVDTGAQMSIMSVEFAERCGLLRLLDERWSGTAVGVGSAPIRGRIHAVKIEIGGAFFPCSFTVVGQGQRLKFILGLDFLRRHQAVIDLARNELRIGDAVAPFLAEKDIPHEITDEAAEEPPARSLAEERLLQRQQQQQQQQQQAPPAAASHTGGHTAPTPVAPPSVHQQAAPGASGSPTPFPEAAVVQLEQLSGRSRAEVIAALQASGGNVDAAGSLLLGLGM